MNTQKHFMSNSDMLQITCSMMGSHMVVERNCMHWWVHNYNYLVRATIPQYDSALWFCIAAPEGVQRAMDNQLMRFLKAHVHLSSWISLKAQCLITCLP